MIKERHGIADAACVNAYPSADKQTVTVTDGPNGTVILLHSQSSPAGLTPEQAEMLADMLRASADRGRLSLKQKA